MPVFWIALRLWPLPTLQKWISVSRVPKDEPQGRENSFDATLRLARLVDAAAARTIGPGNCLTRSLVLMWLLSRRGIATQLRIGVRLLPTGLLAHAWVELEGHPINDRADVGSEYAAFEGSLSHESFRT